MTNCKSINHASTCKKWTPLGYAIEKQNKDIVALLIEKGADKDKFFVSRIRSEV